MVALGACAGKSSVVASGERDKPGKGPENTVPAMAGTLEECNDATPVYTLADLAAGKGDGERIMIDLVPEVKGLCTLLDCGDAECCNQCRGGYGARLVGQGGAPDLELRLEGAMLAGCGGMECNFHCEPFGRKPVTTYRFVGTHTFTPAGRESVYHKSVLAVERFCTLSGGATPSAASSR